jgi:hypothetical protein
MERAAALNGYTPTNLHYVRNHGPTPRLDWSTHTVEVSGLVNRPRIFTMDEIVSLPSVTIPVTLVSQSTLCGESYTQIQRLLAINQVACSLPHVGHTMCPFMHARVPPTTLHAMDLADVHCTGEST